MIKIFLFKNHFSNFNKKLNKKNWNYQDLNYEKTKNL